MTIVDTPADVARDAEALEKVLRVSAQIHSVNKSAHIRVDVNRKAVKANRRHFLRFPKESFYTRIATCFEREHYKWHFVIVERLCEGVYHDCGMAGDETIPHWPEYLPSTPRDAATETATYSRKKSERCYNTFPSTHRSRLIQSSGKSAPSRELRARGSSNPRIEAARCTANTSAPGIEET